MFLADFLFTWMLLALGFMLDNRSYRFSRSSREAAAGQIVFDQSGCTGFIPA